MAEKCCHTCFHFRSEMRGMRYLGECTDPTKRIIDSAGVVEVRSKLRFPLEVYNYYVCPNHAEVARDGN